MSLMSIQKAFYKGMNKVFKTLFTEECEYCFLEEYFNVPNEVYGENKTKVYGEPIKLSASVRNSFEKDELPIGAVNVNCIITVPTQQMISNGLISGKEATLEELDTLQKGKFCYKGIEYLVSYVSMQTHVGDSYQFYKFFCYIDKKEDMLYARNENDR